MTILAHAAKEPRTYGELCASPSETVKVPDASWRGRFRSWRGRFWQLVGRAFSEAWLSH